MILICGPCVIETYDILSHTVNILLNETNIKNNFNFYFKSSCIKDNRTKLENYYGPGFDKGLEYLLKIKQIYNINITTDFHNPEQIIKYHKYVDLIQIPAFLARQTSLLITAAETNKPIHIKKPQFLGPHEIDQIINKIRSINANVELIICDRGTSFGYDYTMFDPRHIQYMKKHFSSNNISFIADITHPNKHWNDNTYAFSIGKSAIVSGADGIFMETHIDPKHSLCDSESMLNIDQAISFIKWMENYDPKY